MVADREDQTKEDLASKFCKRRKKIANFSPKKTKDTLLLENHQVLSQTNWNNLILSQKNQKMNTGGGTPSISCNRQQAYWLGSEIQS